MGARIPPGTPEGKNSKNATMILLDIAKTDSFSYLFVSIVFMRLPEDESIILGLKYPKEIKTKFIWNI